VVSLQQNIKQKKTKSNHQYILCWQSIENMSELAGPSYQFIEAATSRSRHARSRTTRGTLYCGLYAAAAAAGCDEEDDVEVMRLLRRRNEPRATWRTRMVSMLPTARS